MRLHGGRFPRISTVTHAGSKITMDVIERIKQTLTGHPVVLYMKGTPEFPMCGFSMRTSQALSATGVEYFSVNVLEDPEIRANLPRYSNWPTFPQLYINRSEERRVGKESRTRSS